MPRAFAAMVEAPRRKSDLRSRSSFRKNPRDYRGELNWLAARIRALGLGDVYVCAPQDIVFTEEALFFRHADGKEDRRSTCSTVTSSCSICSTCPSKS